MTGGVLEWTLRKLSLLVLALWGLLDLLRSWRIGLRKP